MEKSVARWGQLCISKLLVDMAVWSNSASTAVSLILFLYPILYYIFPVQSYSLAYACMWSSLCQQPEKGTWVTRVDSANNRTAQDVDIPLWWEKGDKGWGLWVANVKWKTWQSCFWEELIADIQSLQHSFLSPSSFQVGQDQAEYLQQEQNFEGLEIKCFGLFSNMTFLTLAFLIQTSWYIMLANNRKSGRGLRERSVQK